MNNDKLALKEVVIRRHIAGYGPYEISKLFKLSISRQNNVNIKAIKMIISRHYLNSNSIK